MKNIEIEARFLEINKETLIMRLCELGAEDLGEDILKEVIFYDKEYKWRDIEHKLIRLRKVRDKVFLTYKHHFTQAIDGTEEIEIEIENMEKGIDFLTKIGLQQARYQEKKRHTFKLKDVTVDIDTWPQVPTYVELEAESEHKIKEIAMLLDLDWTKVTFESPLLLLKIDIISLCYRYSDLPLIKLSNIKINFLSQLY